MNYYQEIWCLFVDKLWLHKYIVWFYLKAHSTDQLQELTKTLSPARISTDQLQEFTKTLGLARISTDQQFQELTKALSPKRISTDQLQELTKALSP